MVINMKDKKQSVAVICSILASALFGLSFMFTKKTVTQVSSLSLLAWRFTFAFVAMSICALFRVIKLDLRKKSIKPLLVIAIFQPVLYFIGETYGIQLTTSSESGAIVACLPIITICMSALLLHEPPTKLQTVSIIVSVAGVILIVISKGLNASLNVWGYLLLLMAMLSDSLYVIKARKAANYTSAEKTYIMAAMGMVVFMSAAFVEHSINGTTAMFLSLPFKDTDFLIGLLYLSICCSVIAFLLTNYSIGIIGANRAASFAGVTTIVSVLAGVVFLNEDFSVIQGIGTLLVLVGVYGANKMPANAVEVKMEDIEARSYKDERK